MSFLEAHFGLITRQDYPVIANMAVRMLLAFSTTYLGELVLSRLSEVKTSKREWLKK
jgi:hypothetical protein